MEQNKTGEKKTRKKKGTVLSPEPLTLSLTLPPVTIRQSTAALIEPLNFSVLLPPVEILGYFLHEPRGTLKHIRKIPFHDLATREAEAEKLKARMPELTATTWRNNYRKRLLSELREGQIDFLWSWLHLFGPRALALALAEPEVVSLLEGWWIDGPIRHDERAKYQLMKTLDLVSKPHFPKEPEYSPQERTQRRKQQNRNAQQQYRKNRASGRKQNKS